MKVRFDESGAIVVRDERLRELVAENAGEWEAVSTSPEMIVLKRAGEAAASVLMSGEVRKEGWLVEIINFLNASRLTGRLTVESSDARRELVFENGSLRLASSTSPSDLLGEFVVSVGMITRQERDEALAEVKPGRRLGQVLVDRGLLSRQDVYLLLTRKFEKIFMDVTFARDGIFYFDEDVDLSKLPASMCIDMAALLMKACEQRDEIAYYRQTRPRPSDKLERRPELVDEQGEIERRLVAQVDGKRTLAEIAGRLDLGELEVMRVARKLANRGLIDVILDRDMEQAALDDAVRDFNLAIVYICDRVKDRLPASELTMLGRDFIEKSAQQIQGLDRVVVKDSGELGHTSVLEVFRSAAGKDRMNVAMMVLSRYLSFILFTANSYLPVAEQEKLSATVYGRLEKYS
jgi:DNA-binding Lrp family transcriptional regulator